MIKRFFQKFGVYLSNNQVKMIKLLVLATVVSVFISLLILGFGVATGQCEISFRNLVLGKNLSEQCAS